MGWKAPSSAIVILDVLLDEAANDGVSEGRARHGTPGQCLTYS